METLIWTDPGLGQYYTCRATPHMEVPQIWTQVPYGAKPQREEVRPQRNAPGIQLWDRSYIGVGRRADNRALQRTLSNRRHGFPLRETLLWKNAHMGLPEGESGHMDTYPSTGADRRPGRANTSTEPAVRLLHPD